MRRLADREQARSPNRLDLLPKKTPDPGPTAVRPHTLKWWLSYPQITYRAWRWCDDRYTACGELMLFAPGGDAIIDTVNPSFGKMVIFLSESFPHAVLRTCKRVAASQDGSEGGI